MQSLAAILLLIVLISINGYKVMKSNKLTTLIRTNERINKKIELENPKVVSTIEISPGQKAVVCRCWLSEKFPYCDGAHNKHNEATGDNVAPAIVSIKKEE